MSDSPDGPQALRAHPSLIWRRYDDGLVVYVGDSSETHCLPTTLAPLLEGPVVVTSVHGLDGFEQEADGSYRLGAEVVNELLQLQILVTL